MRKALAFAVALAAAAMTIAAAPVARAAPPVREAAVTTNATYFNDASTLAADPYVLYDSSSGYYYAYSTADADHGYYFGVYRSADLATWEKVGPGALPTNDRKQWGEDWFWAPEVYHNTRTGLYFLFYAARSIPDAKRWFGYANFDDPSKIGVAVSRSPAGPFHNIAAHPIDYNPYDPTYHDINLIMKPSQVKPPATLASGDRAHTGTYIAAIDPDVFFVPDGHQYMFYSRATRNWVWDPDYRKYVQESDILAVELTTNWWNDRRGRTMPTIAPAYRGASDVRGGPRGPRRDGFVHILDYEHEKQSWENADVNDYKRSHGTKEDRRWEEGSTTIARDGVYYLFYSANNWQAAKYGVGYAVATSPLGPWTKYPGNPILSQSPSVGMYSTGHGSVALSPDGSEVYYVHHGRPSPADPHRWLYTDRIDFGSAGSDPFGFPIVGADQSTSDQPIPPGVAPFSIRARPRSVHLRPGGEAHLSWSVTSARGADLALDNPLDRVQITSSGPGVVAIDSLATGATIRARHRGQTTITLTYQRELASGAYDSVYDITGSERRIVATTISVNVGR
jgi:GH43 family beta-xylosidase